ncbi:hypothetical protein [Actinoplanes solisilvae]|uniref:hypothetical protein n=1 Tax=Actinoplanes solisilvae TaxID=2486853 RepID=UPI000FD99391|nr:hypothetical protein [Actinoplanes solisilvae]
MGTSYDYANDDAIKQMGLYNLYDDGLGGTSSTHPNGWTQLVIKRIEDVGGDTTGFSPDEVKAWEWYQNNVLDPDGWDKTVSQYKDSPYNSGQPTPDSFKPFDSKDDYITKPGSGFKPPSLTAYSGPDNKSGQLSVSFEAIQYFINELKAIAGDGSGMLLDVRADVNKLDIRPGGFARAELMRQKVMGSAGGDPGLRGDTMDLFTNVHSTLFDMQVELRNMLTEYQNAEDFNKMTADQFGDVLDGTLGKMDNISQYGKSNSSSSGGGETDS